MQRVHFYFNDTDHRQFQSFLSEQGIGISEFVRNAVKEKMDRDRIGANVDLARETLEDLADQLRGEMARMRKDVLDDHQRTAALLTEENRASHEKNELLFKAFVRTLAGTEAPRPSASTAKQARPTASTSSIPGIND